MDKNKDLQKKEKTFLGIREIASIANVSTATVSRVINHPEKCSENTRNKVEQIIKEYKYVPNENIKHIFSKSSKTIAIFIYDITNPFYTQLIMELNELCFKEHYTLLICASENDLQKEKAYLELCLAKRCEGIILTEGVSNRLFENIDIPFVSLDRKDNTSISCITSESYYSIRKIVNYLYNLGHRKIAFVGPEKNLCTVENRFQGYYDELKEKDIICKDYIFKQGKSQDSKLGRTALQYFLSLSDMPTAIVCSNDMVALGVINEATLMSIPVPEALSVCGFDHVLDEFLHIPLTTVEQNIPQLASELFYQLTNPPKKPMNKVIDSFFIPGQTCATLSN